MSATVNPSAHDEITELKKRITQLETVRTSYTSPVFSQPSRSRFWNVLEMIGLVAVAGAIFWLGSINSTVNATSAKVDKLTDAIMSPSKESISSRMAVLETRIDSMDNKLDGIAKKLDHAP